MKQTLFFLAAVIMLAANMTQGAEPAELGIIPRPVKLERQTGVFEITAQTRIVAGEPARELAGQLADRLAPAMGFRLRVGGPAGSGKAIELQIRPELTDLGKEGYRLTVTDRKITITGADRPGVFYGTMTLCQMLPPAIFQTEAVAAGPWQAPCVTIEDSPRFGWRGMHLDVGRYFMPKDFVKKYIDLIALHKMNVFHWHLTEDQGWRIEIKKYPKLTEVGAWRAETVVGHAGQSKTFDGKRHGGFYTQDDIREIVAYAAERFVTVVPEIEMPGHSQAALAAYPELGNVPGPLPVHTNWGVNYNVFNVDESTILFLQDVLTEVMALFPGQFIHIGGDEAPKKQWKESPKAQARMKELGLKNEEELQSWFIKRMDTFLAEHGRRLIGWDEILEGGLAPGAAVMSWRGEAGGIAAAKAGHDVVMAPNGYTYLDYYQADPKGEPLAIGGFLPLRKVYQYDPIPAAMTAVEARHVLGAQAQVWTEYIPTPQQAEYMAFPRMCALAEVVWTPRDRCDYNDFFDRLHTHVRRLDALKVNYHPLIPEPAVVGHWKTGQTGEAWCELTWPIAGVITEAGIYEIGFNYTGGAHRLDIAWAQLLQGDTVVARDEHEGITGGQVRNNTYRLEVKPAVAAADYRLVARVRSDGGADSNGEVTIKKIGSVN